MAYSWKNKRRIWKTGPPLSQESALLSEKMSGEIDKARKCFTFIWKVENADYWWMKDEFIESPAFTVEQIDETKWKLQLYFASNYTYCDSNLFLWRDTENTGTENIKIDFELAYLSSDGTVLHSFEEKNSVISEDEDIGSNAFPSWNEMFFARRLEFFSQNSLKIRCRMWKSVGEISKDVQCFARTRIAVEKRSSIFNIENFDTLVSGKKQSYEIKSLETGERLMRLELFLRGGQIYDETIHLKIIPNHPIVKISTLQLSIVGASKNTLKCFQSECWFDDDPYDSKDFTLVSTKRALMEKKKEYLPNDVLSLLCESSFCFGHLLEEIEESSSNCAAIGNMQQDVCGMDEANELPVPEGILINDFKSMLNNSLISDVKLKTKSKTYPAHKFILGVRSPVFKAMFSSDMREKINDCVDIDDLSDETVLQMLRYLYSADVEELEWGRATELYEAADKYEILNLKDICSSFLKTNLHPNNACEALVLADMHQHEDLKRFVQDFILRHGKDVINSEDWKQLMESNLKLAAETMCLKFKE